MNKINAFTQLLNELSMITYDDGKRFDPTGVQFILDGGTVVPKKAGPLSRLAEAYKSKRNVWLAAFYGAELRVGVSFDKGMHNYGIYGLAYLGDRSSEPVRATIPLQTATLTGGR